MFYFNLIFAVASLPGCNELEENGRSKCSTIWQEGHVDALKCCVSNRVGSRNIFDVPVITIQSRLPVQNQCRKTFKKRCFPNIKCLPLSFYDLEGYFNYLDFLQKIPFTDFENHQKPSNWNCYNSLDDFKNFNLFDYPSHRRQFNPKRLENIRKRLKNNFCRTLLLKYYLTYGPKTLSKDVCLGSSLTKDHVLPHQINSRDNRLSHFDQRRLRFLDESTLAHSISFLDKNNHFDRTYIIDSYIRNRKTTSVGLFYNYEQIWAEFNVHFNGIIDVHCGCFGQN